MKRVKLIAIVGMPGSGKGTCTDYMADTFDWPVVHFGNMVYEEVAKRGLHNVNDEKFVREDMRAQEGPDVLAKRVAVKAEEYFKDGAEVVVLDGLYSWPEFKYLHEKYDNEFMTIAVTAPRHVRHERVVNRKDGHRSYTLDQIRQREVEEIEFHHKGDPIAYANYTINNDATPEHMLAKLDAILQEHQLEG
jgi:dephospho-CoA kinase